MSSWKHMVVYPQEAEGRLSPVGTSGGASNALPVGDDVVMPYFSCQG